MSVTIFDTASVLTATEELALQSTPTSHVFKLLVQNPATRGELQSAVKVCVDAPNVICAGVSPQLRYTWTEIGIDTGIRSGDYQQVGRAGNADFKAGNWADGLAAIISRAEVLTHARTTEQTGVVIQEHKTVVDHGVSAWPFIIGFG